MEKKAFIFGFFYGDGSCGKYDCLSGKKYSWALNNKNIDIRFDNIVDENIVMQIQQLYKRKPFIVKFINQIIYGKR